MGFFNRSSIIGLVAGAILSPLIIIGGLYFYMTRHTPQMQEMRYPPPEMPMLGSETLDWAVESLKGETVNLEKDFHDKVVFLNFWATWCPPCIAEAPSIESLYRKLGHRVAFACISNESIETLQAFRQKHGYTFPMYRRSQGPPPQFNTSGIPATFILSRGRKVLLKHVGGADWSHESVVQFLEKILAAKPDRVAEHVVPSGTTAR